MAWDNSQNNAVIYARQDIYSTDRVYPSPQLSKEVYIKIYFSKSLYNLFSTFYYIKQNPNDDLKMDYQLVLDSANDTNVLQAINTNIQPLNRYLQIFQMVPTINSMAAVSSIVFCSDAIPVIPSNINKPHIIFNNTDMAFQRGLNDQTANIISDLVPGPEICRSDIYYVPAGQNRYISLTDNKQPIKNIDLTVYWRDNWETQSILFSWWWFCICQTVIRKKQNI